MNRIAIVLVLAACGNGTKSPREHVEEFAATLRASCPEADTSDIVARDACADALTDSDVMRDSFADEVLWGGQPAGFMAADLVEDATLTRFASRILRRMYLSTFEFVDAPPIIEQQGEYMMAYVPVVFRSRLPAGEYPYPFWHSQPKWKSYQAAAKVVFVFDKDGKVVAGARSDEQDPTRPLVDKTWDGIWAWNDGQDEPRVSLYKYLFSSANPYVGRLEASYRALEEGFRESTCITCHSPDNKSGMRHLEILSYPNQALSGRAGVVKELSANVMPPKTADNPTTGIDDETTRLMLLELAKTFEALGDQAMAFDGE